MRDPGRFLALALASLLPALAVVAARDGARRVGRWLEAPALGGTYPVTLELPAGSGAGTASAELAERGLVSSARAFRLYLQASGRAGRLKAGEYLVEKPLSPEELAALLVSGRVLLHPFTIPEGLDAFETARVLAGSGWWTEDALLEAFRDPGPVAAVDGEAPDLEGYLFPETYHFAKGTTPRDVARALAARFVETWTRLGGHERAASLGLRPRDVATLASLVEEETSIPQERRLVSSVYHNRVRRGMRLEADPTVIHGLKRDGLWTGGELLLSQLQHPSPYNTYQVPGLPPGPICSFGEESLAAALDPASSNLLFFVATGTGGHRFAETLADHERNVRLYRQARREARLSAGAADR